MLLLYLDVGNGMTLTFCGAKESALKMAFIAGRISCVAVQLLQSVLNALNTGWTSSFKYM